jgi:hypothetical protein
MNYYDRTATMVNGAPFFSNSLDARNETETARQLEKAWRCEIRPFGQLCPIDFYALRNSALVGLLELKSRTHESTKYPTIWLNLRKWLALTMGETGLGVPALFVVKFLDGLYYIPVNEVPTNQIKIGGTKHIVKSHTDIEPVIEIPVERLIKVEK